VTSEKEIYIKQWLSKAEDDLKAYQLLMNAESALFAIAAFHLQQSAEKYLKAYLEYNIIPFSKTHDIEYLLQMCAQVNVCFGEINAGNLTDYAVDLRYPGDIYEINKKELEVASHIVFDIKQLVLCEVIF
jgi:HEPN domain-containing protein